MGDKKSIKVVSGDGSNLKISPVYDHITAATPKSSENKPKNIVVPKEVRENKKNQKEKK